MGGITLSVAPLVGSGDARFAVAGEPLTHRGGDDRAAIGREASVDGSVECVDDLLIEAGSDRNADGSEATKAVHESYTLDRPLSLRPHARAAHTSVVNECCRGDIDLCAPEVVAARHSVAEFGALVAPSDSATTM